MWVVRKVRTDILLADLVCFEVQCLPQSADLKIFQVFIIWWCRFKSAYTVLKFCYASSCLSSSLLPSSFIIICLFSCTWWRKFSVESTCVSLFLCVLSYRWIHFPRSVLSILSTSPVVLHSFFRKRMFSFIFIKITWVVVLYTSLRLVEGVYKPQRACVGWTNVTESWLEACMWIKHTCLDEFPPGHPKMFERTLDIILLFILAISNTINLFLSFFVLFSMKMLGTWNYFTQTVQI